MRPAVAVFDLDGTLIDSAADLHRALNHMLTELGCAPLPLAEVRSMIGDGMSLLIARALAARRCVVDPATALPLFLNHYEADPAELTRLYPGVDETLERLRARGVTLAICTNKPARLTRVILGRLGIERHFSRVIGGDSLPFRKPDPRAVARPAAAAGLPAIVASSTTRSATSTPASCWKRSFRRWESSTT